MPRCWVSVCGPAESGKAPAIQLPKKYFQWSKLKPQMLREVIFYLFAAKRTCLIQSVDLLLQSGNILHIFCQVVLLVAQRTKNIRYIH